MATTGTVVVGLVYRDGILIGSDSQASDPDPEPNAHGFTMAGVRWPTTKLFRPREYPLVAAFAGNTGSAARFAAALDAATIYGKQFHGRSSIRDRMDQIYAPEFAGVRTRASLTPAGYLPPVVHGLAAVGCRERLGLLEHEINVDSGWHDHFHAIGSGRNAAYAIFRALGGKDLCRLSERGALAAVIRIIETVIDVEMAGVDEPLDIWKVTTTDATRYSRTELDAQQEFVELWVRGDRDMLFDMDSKGP